MRISDWSSDVCSSDLLVATRSSDDPVRSDWWLGEPPSGAELAVVTYVGSSSCNEFDRVEVSQSDEAVVVESYIAWRRRLHRRLLHPLHAGDARRAARGHPARRLARTRGRQPSGGNPHPKAAG